jgi:hypothetical protein
MMAAQSLIATTALNTVAERLCMLAVADAAKPMTKRFAKLAGAKLLANARKVR